MANEEPNWRAIADNLAVALLRMTSWPDGDDRLYAHDVLRFYEEVRNE